jgi:hypothetical protein
VCGRLPGFPSLHAAAAASMPSSTLHRQLCVLPAFALLAVFCLRAVLSCGCVPPPHARAYLPPPLCASSVASATWPAC